MFDYTVATWGLPQALHYTDLIEAACAALADNPYRAQSRDELRPGYRSKRVEHHVLFLQERDYGIAVIRILHERMDPARHL